MGGASAYGRTAGRLLLAAGLCFWIAVSLDRIPFCRHHLGCIIAALTGSWGTSDLMHPLFPPLLKALHGTASLLGRPQDLLMAVELLNLVAGILCLLLLFATAERLSPDVRDGVQRDLAMMIRGRIAELEGGKTVCGFVTGQCNDKSDIPDYR